MNNIEWFDNYDGPKSLSAIDGTAICRIGYNVGTDAGYIIGSQIQKEATSVQEVVALVRQEYESTVNVFSAT